MSNNIEYDVSEVAWEVYKKMYYKYILDLLESKKGTKRKFAIGNFKHNNKEIVQIKFSGETDFNFKKGWAHTNLTKYEKLLLSIDDKVYQEMYRNNLKLCKELMHTVVNISLMPQTGNIQCAKKGLGNDRIDTYVWALHLYYTKGIFLLSNYSSIENYKSLKDFVDIFKNEEDYCKVMYGIDRGLVRRLVESGCKAIDTPERTIEYMNLALSFWNQRLRLLNSLNNKSKELTNEIEKVNILLSKFYCTKNTINLHKNLK